MTPRDLVCFAAGMIVVMILHALIGPEVCRRACCVTADERRRKWLMGQNPDAP